MGRSPEAGGKSERRARYRMTTNQAYFRSATNLAEDIAGLAPRALRSNRMIDRALREAYQKYDRTEQVQKLLRRYLPGQMLVVVYRD